MSVRGRLAELIRHRPVAELARETLAGLAGGELSPLPVSLRFWDGSLLPGAAPAGEPVPTLVLRRPRALAHLVHEPGELGLSRAYVDGSITTDDDLETLLALRGRMRRIALARGDRARLLAGALRAGGPRLLRPPPVPAIEAHVGGTRHSRGRDRASVRHHYDVSNDFYRLLLGPSLVYSCAYYDSPEDSLETAQARKLELICRKLDLRPGERLLDIGCGWGSLLLHAAEHHGVHATGVTLSEPQARLARERAAQLGLADRVEVLVADYRELTGQQFQKISSVGMYEHVGRAELGRYAATARELLAPGGLMLNHGIADLSGAPPDDKSFIARYIFPDGELHPLGDLVDALQASSLEIRDVESLREHYPLTLRAWVGNLRERRDQALGFVGPERDRTWELYLLGSALAFETGLITVYQVLVTRPGAPHHLPLDRVSLLAPELDAV